VQAWKRKSGKKHYDEVNQPSCVKCACRLGLVVIAVMQHKPQSKYVVIGVHVCFVFVQAAAGPVVIAVMQHTMQRMERLKHGK
jgi:hypothetical protein